MSDKNNLVDRVIHRFHKKTRPNVTYTATHNI